MKTYMAETVREAKERGYTTTIFGRRRQITELASDNFRIRQMGERMAQNAPVQGSAADVFKLAMIELDHALDEAGLRARRCCSPCTTSSCSKCPIDERDAHRDDRARGDGERHRAARAARRRHRLRPHLGHREVARRSLSSRSSWTGHVRGRGCPGGTGCQEDLPSRRSRTSATCVGDLATGARRSRSSVSEASRPRLIKVHRSLLADRSDDGGVLATRAASREHAVAADDAARLRQIGASASSGSKASMPRV